MAKSWFPKPVGPRAALSDLTALIFQQHRRHRLVFLTLSIGITSLIVTGFVIEARDKNLIPGPKTIYVSDWKTTRTDAEIIAQQKIDSAERRAWKEERRRQFQRLDKAMTRWGF